FARRLLPAGSRPRLRPRELIEPARSATTPLWTNLFVVLISEAYSAGFDFVAAVFRLRGRFGDFGAAPLRTARTFCSCSEAADAARGRRSLPSLRSCFSRK